MVGVVLLPCTNVYRDYLFACDLENNFFSMNIFGSLPSLSLLQFVGMNTILVFDSQNRAALYLGFSVPA